MGHTSFSSFLARTGEWLEEEEQLITAHLLRLRAHSAAVTGASHSRIHTASVAHNATQDVATTSERKTRTHDIETRAALVQEEARSVHRSSEIHSRINSCLPACSLPNELLAHIFLSCVTDHGSQLPRSQSFYSCVQDVLNISQVCQLWRKVALDCPRLWTVLPVGRRKVAEAFLKRVGTIAPYASFIHEEGHALSLSGLSSMYSPISQRFAGLEIIADQDTVSRMLLNFQSVSAGFGKLRWDSLATLRIRCTNESIMFLHTTFQFAPPGLRHFDLSGVVPSSQDFHGSFSSFAPNLHTLRLSAHFMFPGLPDMPAFLDLLESCVSLQELYLDRSGPKPLKGEILPHPVSQRSVRMEKLKILDVCQWRGIDIAHLLLHLVIQTTASIALQLYQHPKAPHPPRGYSSPEFLSWLTANLDIFSGLQSIHIGGSPEGQRELLGFSERVPYDYRSGRQPRLRVGLPIGDEESILTAAGFQIAIAMSHITLLNIYCNRGWIGRSKASQWRTIFSSLKQLTTLQYHHIPSKTHPTDSSLQLMKNAVVLLLNAITPESTAATPPVL